MKMSVNYSGIIFASVVVLISPLQLVLEYPSDSQYGYKYIGYSDKPRESCVILYLNCSLTIFNNSTKGTVNNTILPLLGSYGYRANCQDDGVDGNSITIAYHKLSWSLRLFWQKFNESAFTEEEVGWSSVGAALGVPVDMYKLASISLDFDYDRDNSAAKLTERISETRNTSLVTRVGTTYFCGSDIPIQFSVATLKVQSIWFQAFIGSNETVTSKSLTYCNADRTPRVPLYVGGTLIILLVIVIIGYAIKGRYEFINRRQSDYKSVPRNY